MKFTTYHVESFGCQMNLSDSERIAGQLERLGCVATDSHEHADIIVMNTCCVRESAESRIFGRIGALKQLKVKHPEKFIVIAGCLAQKDQDLIFRRASHVDLVLGTQNIDRLAEILSEKQKQKRRVESKDYVDDGLGDAIGKSRYSGVSAWVPVMFGCDNYCSYCIVPYVRGRERSRPVESILKEIRDFVAAGGREVTLLGQNVNSYGNNLGDEWDFPQLLAEIDKISGIERIRFMTSHPKDLSTRLIAAMSGGSHICEHLHLPVQSGCDEILHRMNRHYTSASYRILIENLRSSLPDISLTTDIIVGFPGETESMFEETLNFVSEMKFDAAFTFIYSKRSGTPAAALPDQVPYAIKQNRLQRLMDLQNEISLQLNQQWVGRDVEVLADGPSKTDAQFFSGRTRQNKLVLWNATADDYPGVIRTVQIHSAQTFLLKGSVNSEGGGIRA